MPRGAVVAVPWGAEGWCCGNGAEPLQRVGQRGSEPLGGCWQLGGGHGSSPGWLCGCPALMPAVTWQLQRAACLLLLLLLCSLAAARQNLPECCRQKTCSCRIYDLLHGMGNHAAGILTLGKRKSVPPAFQSRLYRLLHGSGNHAAGILTMGKRGEHPGTGAQPTPALRGTAASPRECQGHAGKEVTKSRGAAKSFD